MPDIHITFVNSVNINGFIAERDRTVRLMPVFDRVITQILQGEVIIEVPSWFGPSVVYPHRVPTKVFDVVAKKVRQDTVKKKRTLKKRTMPRSENHS